MPAVLCATIHAFPMIERGLFDFAMGLRLVYRARATKRMLAALFVVLSASGALAQPPVQSSQKPVWTFDLEKNSPSYAARMDRLKKVFRPSLPRPQLAFLDSKTLAVSFADGSWQDYPGTTRGLFHFRTFFIDTEKRALTGPTLSWPTPDDDSTLLPLADRGFIILAGNQLVRYSSDFSVEKQASVPADPGNEGPEFENYNAVTVYQIGHWRAQEDPKEEVVILVHSGPDGGSYFWIDPRSLKATASSTGEGADNHISDTAGQSLGLSSRISRDTILPASQAVIYNSLNRPILATAHGSQQYLCSSFEPSFQATFASDDKLFFKYLRDRKFRYALVDDQCRVLLDLPGLNNGEVDAVSSAGNRIAITERPPMRTSFLTRTVTTGLRIRVWDLDPSSEVYELSFAQGKRGSVVGGMDDFAVALSPDGKMLAVLIDATLMVYAI